MKDRLFYPLAALTITAIIAFALRSGGPVKWLSSEDVIAQGYRLSGESFRQLTMGPGTRAELVTDKTGALLHTVMLTTIPKAMTTPSAGIFGVLGPVYEQTFSGKALQITITARAGDENPLAGFQAAYFSNNSSSGWQEFSLTKEYGDYIFYYTPPKQNKISGREYIGVWPGKEGDSKAMNVKMIKVEIAKP